VSRHASRGPDDWPVRVEIPSNILRAFRRGDWDALHERLLPVTTFQMPDRDVTVLYTQTTDQEAINELVALVRGEWSRYNALRASV
jgi:hypothetical protein